MEAHQDINASNFEQSVRKLWEVFQEYSILDIAYSLLISSLWLPNIASIVKQQLLYSAFLSIKPDQFSKVDKIHKYTDFRLLIKRITTLLPEFPFIEDYVPEADWGDVKFHHDGVDYKIFYGCELENTYDYLMLFQVLYSSRDDDYLTLESRSPNEELHDSLTLQETIIEAITSQPSSKDLRISPGDLKVPPKTFWKHALDYFQSFTPQGVVSSQFIDLYSSTPGSFPEGILSYEKFANLVSEGQILPFFFIRFDSRLIPIMPRRYSAILIEEWAKVFSKHETRLNEKDAYAKHISVELYHFLEKRVRSKSLFPLVSAITKDENAHEIVFTCSFVSKNRLILIYNPAPFSSGKEMGRRLNKVAPILRHAVDLISSPPVSIALLAQEQIVKFESSSSGGTLIPEVFIVVSPTSAAIQPVVISRKLPGRIISLDQFLGLFDEIENSDEISEFLDYLEGMEPKFGASPFVGMLDKYGSYKDSAGVLVNGARDPDIVMLDPHWGSTKRYETLSKFWALYPKGGFFDHPRSWKIEPIVDRDVRLIARGYLGSAVCCELAISRFITTAPFDKMSFHQGLISDLMMGILEDNIHRNGYLLDQLNIFKYYQQVLVNFFPWGLVKGNKKFQHLVHLDPGTNLWGSDVGWVKTGVLGVRVVFKEEIVADVVEQAKDSSFEIDLLTEVLDKLNEFAPDPKFEEIKEELAKLRTNKPRFKMIAVEKEVSFPEFVSPIKPSPHYLKEAAKMIAQLCRDIGITPGEYALEEAEAKLNTLRERLVELMNIEVKKYDFEKSISYLIERIDALISDYEGEISHLEYSLEHEVDYQREEKYANKHSEFVSYHRAYRYLIEKFVQLTPTGNSSIDNDQFQLLVALAGKIVEIYNTSDSIHYDIYQSGLKIDYDFIMDVTHTIDLHAMGQSYSEEEAKIRLGLMGNKSDQINSSEPIEEFIEKLDHAFFSDLGFGIRSLISVLQVLSQWAGYVEGVKEHTWYLATEKQISDVCTEVIEGVDEPEVFLILNFLTLKPNEVVCLVGKENPEPDIPVWEYRKRFARYNLRPLIRTMDSYLWGPYSARKSGTLWAQTPINGQTPYDMESAAIQKAVEEEKRLVESALVEKTEEIVKRFTQSVEKNLNLCKRDKEGKHPDDLGDYDVLAYYPERNIIINIEDKDLLPPFCLKDAKRLREKIFGRDGKDDGYLRKVERREEYLAENIIKIAQLLKWKIDPDRPPRIVSLFVSRQAYWWTKYPPITTNIRFLRIEMLDYFIKTLEHVKMV